ncbi:UDP-3-O-(3-hydroxymyristoyl)glucosamine N-acyltransferase [Candidatus Margulisiibacteriota bacterium]
MILSEVAKIIAGSINGDASLEIKEISNIENVKAGGLCFVLEEKNLKKADASAATVLVVKKGWAAEKVTIEVEHPRIALAAILPHFSKRGKPKVEIHDKAVIAKSAKIGEKASIGPFVVIGENVVVGDNVVIHPGVTIYDNVTIGNNVILHAGAVIGVDGYGFVPTKELPIKIPQIGTVVIEDDVEIYANACIARGVLGETRLGRGTKIDNLTHVAHNCSFGEACLITGQVGYAGSVTMGHHVMVAGQAGFNGHIKVGDNCVVLGKAGVTKDIPANTVISGFPAQAHKKELQRQAKLNKLLEEK